ncbi:MAG: SdrD B-like domain-containing protein [Candidatus Saccharimonadales bacterium]
MVQTLQKKIVRVASVFAAGVLLLTQFAFAPLAGATSGGYNAVLHSPLPPASTDTFVWKITGSKPGRGEEISHITLNGCWTKHALKSVTITAGTKELKEDGTIKVDDLQDDDLPLTVTVVFKQAYASTGTANIFVKTGGGPSAGFGYQTAGPNCQAPEYGKIEVNKKVDSDGNNVYEGGNGTANGLGFRWGVDGETPAHTMGSHAAATVGTHTVTEKMVNGYVFTGWYYTHDSHYSCAKPRGTTLPVEINVEKGKTKKITLCNQAKNGNITIVKDAQPNNDQNFYFKISKQNSPWDQNFTLDDDGNSGNQHSNTKSFDNLLAGTYIVTENGTNGWTLGDIVCSEGANVITDKANRKATIAIDHDDAVTCTFVNQKNGKLKVYKHTDPAGDQTDFAIEAAAVSGTVLSDPTKLIADGEYETFYVTQGTYTVNETLPAGWAQTQNTCANVVVSADNLYATCHITNTKQAKLKIVKDAYPAEGQDFNFSSALGNFSLKDDDSRQFSGLNPGIYTVSEDALANWDLTNLVCSGADSYSVDWQNRSVNVTLKAGNDATCTFTNEQRSAIHGYKFEDTNGNGQWDDGEGTLEGWIIRLAELCEGEGSETVVCEGSEQSATTNQYGYYRFEGLQAGYYIVCEGQQDGWMQTYPLGEDCHYTELGGQGDEQYGNFGNFQLGQVGGVKFNDINGNGQRDNDEPLLKDWEVTLTTVCENRDLLSTQTLSVNSCAAPQVTKTDAQGRYSFGNLQPGAYKVCETQKTTWQQTYPGTKDGCHQFAINTSGQVIAADFGNKAKPQILGDQTSPHVLGTATTLVKTGSPTAAKSIAIGLSILGALGAIHFLHSRRKDYAK